MEETTTAAATSSSFFFFSEDDLHLHNFSSILGLGLALGLTFLSKETQPKPLSVAIKLTNSALSSFKVIQFLHHPSPPESLLFASKTLVKTYKLTKTLSLLQPTLVKTLVGGLKPLLGVVGLLRCIDGSSAVFDNGYLGFGVLSYGYKFSKNFFRVLNGVSGVELDDAFRNLMESLGIVVKAVKVAQEVEQITTAGERMGAVSSCCYCCSADVGIGGSGSSMYRGLCCSGCGGLDLDGKIRVLASERLSSDERDLGVERFGDGCVSSQLLCLSIPIRETCLKFFLLNCCACQSQ